MNIKEIANIIDAKEVDYEIGSLQSIRKDIKGLKKRAGNTIFAESTIYEDYAFHYGGRSEIQFNIGKEDEGFRYGLAFSLEPSQSLPDPSILFPKILKLNCLIREQPGFFKAYKMWYYKGGERSEISEVVEIGQDLIKTNTFIFFGKISDEDKISVNYTLQTFDDLLWVYKVVENDSFDQVISGNGITPEFYFDNKSRNLAKKAIYTTQEREINIEMRHSYLQELLQSELETEFGKENVSIENPCDLNKIDVVVKAKDGFHFYEVKTASSAKSCVRQAIGQLMEYAYGNGKRNASKIFIAGEFHVDYETNIFLNYLRNEFKIPIFYKRIEK